MTPAPALPLDEERNLLAIAHGVVGRYLQAHPALRYAEDDLLADALLGVGQAAARWTPTGGSTLPSYAYRRATGAVLDGIRERAPLTRADARADGGTDRARAAGPLSLEALTEAGWNPPAYDPEDPTDDHRRVHALLRLCTPLEQYVTLAVTAYGYTVTEIARHLGITESAVSQIKAKALRRMRSGLAARRSTTAVPLPRRPPA